MGTLFVFLNEQLKNLAKYRQFTNAAWDWIIQKKKEEEEKKIKVALSLGYPNSYFYDKKCNILLYWLYLSFSWLYKVAAFCQCQCQIPKISLGTYIFQRPFLRGLFLEGSLRFKIDWANLIVGRKFTVFALFYFVFEGNFQVQAPEGLIFGGVI